MNVLLTGGAGFLGEALVEVLTEDHAVTLLDPQAPPFHSRAVPLRGSVTDHAEVLAAMKGRDALVIAHMAPRKPDAYLTPEASFQINVTGTANLLHAARAEGVKRIVLVSSESALSGYPSGTRFSPDLPPRAHDDLYCLTKAMQERLAEHWASLGDVSLTVLRIGYVIDGRTRKDKYGKTVKAGSSTTDRFDIARAVKLALEKPSDGLRTYFVCTGERYESRFDGNTIAADLGWSPRFPLGVSLEAS